MLYIDRAAKTELANWHFLKVKTSLSLIGDGGEIENGIIIHGEHMNGLGASQA